MKDTIKCALCGMESGMQIAASHLRVKHNMTTKEYRALGYPTVSPARLEQLRNNPVGSGKEKGVRGKFGPDHWNWQGGHVNGQGYRITYHKGKRAVEHRVVAEQMLGRSLHSDEVVHHIDGDRANNESSNLVVMTKKEHDNAPRQGARTLHKTGPDCIRAAHALLGLGWKRAAIARALRTEPAVINNWLSQTPD